MYDELYVLDIKLVFSNKTCFIVLYFLDINKFNEAFKYFSRFVGSTRIDGEIPDRINNNHYKIEKSKDEKITLATPVYSLLLPGYEVEMYCTEDAAKEIIKEYNFKALSYNGKNKFIIIPINIDRSKDHISFRYAYIEKLYNNTINSK